MNPCPARARVGPSLLVAALFISANDARAAPTSLVPGVRCAPVPRDAESLGNRHHGQVRRDSAGVHSAHFWHEFGDRLGAPAIWLEGPVVRAVYVERPDGAPPRPEDACPKDVPREHFVLLPTSTEAPLLQASEWIARHELPDGRRVEVSRSYDCGGSIAQAGRRSREEGRTIFLHRLDDRTVRGEVWHHSSGNRSVTPIVEAQGKTIRIGYREAPADGPAVACRIFSRYTFLIQGAGSDVTVELKTQRTWSVMEWMLAGLVTLVGAAILLAIRQRFRRGRSPPPELPVR